jgi:hypothetical protein
MSPWGADCIFILVSSCDSSTSRSLSFRVSRAIVPGARRSVSEGSTQKLRSLLCDFPADCPHHLSHCHRRSGSAGYLRSFQQQAEFFLTVTDEGRNLLTTSPQSPIPPSTAPSQRVGPPASGVTDFRGVTGGVYKTRERIHRSIADLRLLATPTS